MKCSSAEGAPGEEPAPSERAKRVRQKMARHYGNSSNELLELFESLKDDLAECSQLFEPYPEP